MSKGSGMGRKRIGSKMEKGIDRCDVSSHSKQCGRAKEVSKGNKKWISTEKEIIPFQADIQIYDKDEE